MWRKFVNLGVSLLILGLLALGCLSCKKSGYTIVVHGLEQADGTPVYLQYADTSRQIIDTCLIKNRTVQFKGETVSVRRVELVLGKKQRIPFFLEEGNIEIDFHEQQFALSGTNSNILLEQYLKTEKEIGQKLLALYEVYGDYLKSKSTDKAYFNRGIRLTEQIDRLNRQKVDMSLRYIDEHRDQEVAVHCLQKVVSYLTANEMDKVVHILSDRVKSSAIGLAVLPVVEQNKLSAVGAVLPNYVLQTPDGKQQAIGDWVGKGDYVLLEFWASWCGPCKKEIPHLHEVLEKYGHKNFKVVGVSMDTEGEAWKKAIDEYGVTWPQLSTLKGFSGDLPRLFQVRGIPTCILVDPDGRIIHRTARGSWLDRFLISEWGDLFKL